MCQAVPSPVDVTVLTLGADWRAGNASQAEYGQRFLEDVNLGWAQERVCHAGPPIGK